jgi:hypothetical protein
MKYADDFLIAYDSTKIESEGIESKLDHLHKNK